MTKEIQEAVNISDEWLLTHRVDLHNTLRAAAAKEVHGKRPIIILSSRVESVVSRPFLLIPGKAIYIDIYRIQKQERSYVRTAPSILVT